MKFFGQVELHWLFEPKAPKAPKAHLHDEDRLGMNVVL
jgi:hypothetical protein